MSVIVLNLKKKDLILWIHPKNGKKWPKNMHILRIFLYIFLKCPQYFNITLPFQRGRLYSIKTDASWHMLILVPLLELALLLADSTHLLYCSFCLCTAVHLHCRLWVNFLFLMPRDIDFIDWYNFETHNNTFNCYKYWACGYNSPFLLQMALGS